MNIIIGRRLKIGLPVFFAIFTGCLCLAGSVAVEQDFDIQVAGQAPIGWRRSWGDQGDDVLMISSERARSGSNSMLVERNTANVARLWGLERTLPMLSPGRIVIEINFMAIGPGATSSFSLELRGFQTVNERLLAFAFFNRQVWMQNVAAGRKNSSGTVLADYQSGRWYRLKIILPASLADGANAIAELTDVVSEKLIGSASVEYVLPKKRLGALMFVSSSSGSFQLFIDDFKVYTVP